MERKPTLLNRRILVVLSALLLPGCSSVSYLLGQGVEQWRLFNRARPVEEILQNPSTDPKVRESLLLVAEAKRFSVESLGLAATTNYSEYVALDREALLWAVAASDPIYLKEETWWFPFVGSVPYLGFFNLEKAHKKAGDLAEENLDVWVREVPAFSSLGWFPDPIYSSMLRGPQFSIVNLVIHESVHATVWIPGSVDFNERLASFVGREGSLRWLNAKYGAASKERKSADQHYGRNKALGSLVKSAIERYKATVEPLAEAGNLEAAKKKKTELYAWFAEKAGNKELAKWNNAALLAYSKYYYDESVFETLLQKCAGDLGRFVRWIQAENEKGRLEDAPEDRLKAAAQEETCVE